MLMPHEQAPSSSNAIAFAKRLADLIPTLRTDRLRLRAPTLSDFAWYAEIALSPKGRFILNDPNRERAWYDFANMVACWLLRGHGLWTVERHEDNEVIGFVLIGFEPGDHEPELGYMLREHAEGRGYATEAARRAMRYAFEELGLTTLVSTMDHDNAASLKVAQKLGGVRDPSAEQEHGNAILVLRYSGEHSMAAVSSRTDS